MTTPHLRTLLPTLLATVVIALGSLYSPLVPPFLCGLALGTTTALRGQRARTAVLTATTAALAGWAAPSCGAPPPAKPWPAPPAPSPPSPASRPSPP